MKVLKGCGQFIAIGEYKALREGNTKTKTRQEQSYANNSLKESWQVLESGVRYCNLYYCIWLQFMFWVLC